MLHMLRRLFWNPRWNDALYLVSLAERQTIAPTEHSLQDITAHIARRLRSQKTPAGALFQFRILYVHRDAIGLHQTVTFEGPITALGRQA